MHGSTVCLGKIFYWVYVDDGCYRDVFTSARILLSNVHRIILVATYPVGTAWTLGNYRVARCKAEEIIRRLGVWANV